MLTPGNNALALRIAEVLKNRCTHETLTGAAEDAGFILGAEGSKRDRFASRQIETDRNSLLAGQARCVL